MSMCDTEGCQGHLGKFQDCVSEAVWETTLDGTGETTGTVEFEGHLTLTEFPEDEELTIDPDGDNIKVTVPAGWYLVESRESGAVYVTRHDTEAEARKIFDAADARYCEWSEVNEPY